MAMETNEKIKPGAGRLRLSAEERVLLFLHDYGQNVDELSSPFYLCQEGMASALGMRVSNLSRTLASLKSSGFVGHIMAHVPGSAKKRKVYFLTSEGKERAGEIAERVNERLVEFRGSETTGGGTKVMSVSDALRLLSRSFHNIRLCDLVEIYLRDGVVDASSFSSIVSRERYVRAIFDMPSVKHFVGREKEMAKMAEMARRVFSGGRGAIFVYGMAGVGKSSLAAEFVNRHLSEKNVLWHRIRPWETADTLVDVFISFFERMGLSPRKPKGGTDNAGAGRGGGGPGIMDLYSLVSSCDRPVVVVFDDVHMASQEVERALRMVFDVSPPGFLPVFVSRKKLAWYSVRDVAVEHRVVEVELSGLSEEEARLFFPDMEENMFREVYSITHGHPFFLELVSRLGVEKVKSEMTPFFLSEILSQVPGDGVEFLKRLSVFSSPVPPGAAGVQISPSVVNDLLSMGLITETGKGVVVHDLVKKPLLDLLTREEEKTYHGVAGRYLVESDDAGEIYEGVLHLLTSADVSLALEKINEIPWVVDYITPADAERILSSFQEFVSESAGDGDRDADVFCSSVLGLLAVARKMISLGEYDLAETAIGMAENVSESTGMNDVAAEMRSVRGFLHSKKREYEEAKASLQKNLDEARKRGDKLLEARTRLDMAVVERHRKRWDKAEEHIRSALSIFRELGDVVGEAAALNNLAVLRVSEFFGGVFVKFTAEPPFSVEDISSIFGKVFDKALAGGDVQGALAGAKNHIVFLYMAGEYDLVVEVAGKAAELLSRKRFYTEALSLLLFAAEFFFPVAPGGDTMDGGAADEDDAKRVRRILDKIRALTGGPGGRGVPGGVGGRRRGFRGVRSEHENLVARELFLRARVEEILGSRESAERLARDAYRMAKKTGHEGLAESIGRFLQRF